MKSLLAIFLLILSQQVVSGYRILGIFPLHAKSHSMIAHELMIGLAERGHQVDVISHFPLEKPISNYKDISIEGSLPSVVNNLTFSDISYIRPNLLLYFFANMNGNRICDLLRLPQFQELIKNPPNDPPYDVVIIELFASPCFLAFGRHLKVPIVGITPSNFLDWLYYPIGNPLNTAITTSFFGGFNEKMTFWERFKNTFRVQSVISQMNYFAGAQNANVKKYFGSDYPDVRDFYKDIAVILTNSHYSLNGVKPWTPVVKEIGGLHIGRKDDIPLSREVETFINDTNDGFVYFTFGSMARFETFPLETINAFFGAFKNIAPVKVLIKVAKPEILPVELPKNVMVQPWFPQITLLKHKKIKAFITHGGLLGTMESFAYGVPMIGIPLFSDQYGNLQNYASKGVAISFKSFSEVTEEKLTDALTSIIKDPSYKKNAQRLSKLFLDRPLTPLDEAIFWVEYVTKYGNILQNPVVHLYWWQRNLLDVYGMLLAIIIIIVMLMLFAFKTIKRILFSKSCNASQNAMLNKKQK